jgi:chlorobactene glucosyltransferase
VKEAGITSVVIACAWLSLIVWLLLRALRQYRHYEVLAPSAAPPAAAPEIAVIVPARDEGHNIGRCLAGLRAQRYPAERLHIIVIDDNSRDGTAECARRAAGDDTRVVILRGRPLPPGWTGKTFACWQGTQLPDCEWLCFVDADTVAAPDCLASAIRVASERGIDMLSLEPFQDMVTAAERLVMMAGFLAVAVCKDLERIARSDTPDADANGQFILIRRAVYEAVGGHAAVRREICEDYALARRVKAAGHRFRLLGGDAMIRARMYTGWSSLLEGLSKNVTNLFGGASATLTAALAAVFLGWTACLLPAALWLDLARSAAHPVSALAAACIATAGSLVLAGVHVAEARYFKIPWWYGLAFPLGYSMAAVIGINGALRMMQGRTEWKGRIYSARSRG